jgi:hypothetical protein
LEPSALPRSDNETGGGQALDRLGARRIKSIFFDEPRESAFGFGT